MSASNITSNTNAKTKSTVYELVTYALFTTVLCILAPMSLPIGPIPVSLTNLVLYLSIFIIGTKGSAISYCVYLLLGAVGLPIFSGYSGGLAKLVGPTGGYLVGFLPMILIMGIFYESFRKKGTVTDVTATMIGMILGTLVAYALGTAWFVLQMDCEVGYALSVCVIPFIPVDLAKMVIANLLGRRIRIPLVKQGLIEA